MGVKLCRPRFPLALVNHVALETGQQFDKVDAFSSHRKGRCRKPVCFQHIGGDYGYAGVSGGVSQSPTNVNPAAPDGMLMSIAVFSTGLMNIRNDEIGAVGKAFNEMAVQIQGMLEEQRSFAICWRTLSSIRPEMSRFPGQSRRRRVACEGSCRAPAWAFHWRTWRMYSSGFAMYLNRF